jgi:uncharacterized protein YndB with AHSA1/START domain
MNIIAKVTTTIDAPATRVWEALTTPVLIKQYFFGTDAISDWKPGSTLVWKGVWEGKEYVDKGVIQKSEPPRLFQYTYFSAFSGLEDIPENYGNITYELDEENGVTTLTVRQENIQSEQMREQSEKNWQWVLDGLKKLLEEQHVEVH